MANVTVIIAHKNYNQYLNDAIQSCINQTIKVNYIVIDDNSLVKPDISDFNKVDNQNIDLYEKDGNKIVLLHKDSGPSIARNIGISLCWDSDYFMILDADDYMMPNKCEVLLKEMLLDDKIGVCYADYYIIDTVTNLRKMEFKTPFNASILEYDCIVHSGSLINKEALKSVATQDGFYDKSIRVAEDYDLWLRISDKKWMIKHIPEFLTVVRNHPNNSTLSNTKEYWQRCLTYIRQKRQNEI